MSKKIKKGMHVLSFITLLVIFTSCSFTGYESESEKIEAMSNEIIRCLTSHDQESFNELFCEKTRNYSNFSEESDALFSFFECDTYVSAQLNYGGSGSKGWDDGVVDYWTIDTSIPWLKVFVEDPKVPSMGQERYYSIEYYWVIVNLEKKEEEGLRYLTLELLNHQKVMVGEQYFQELDKKPEINDEGGKL